MLSLRWRGLWFLRRDARTAPAGSCGLPTIGGPEPTQADGAGCHRVGGPTLPGGAAPRQGKPCHLNSSAKPLPLAKSSMKKWGLGWGLCPARRSPKDSSQAIAWACTSAGKAAWGCCARAPFSPRRTELMFAPSHFAAACTIASWRHESIGMRFAVMPPRRAKSVSRVLTGRSRVAERLRWPRAHGAGSRGTRSCRTRASSKAPRSRGVSGRRQRSLSSLASGPSKAGAHSPRRTRSRARKSSPGRR